MSSAVDAAVHHRGYRCHACSVDVSGKFRNEGQMLSAFLQYESAVEYIESLPRGATFSRMTVWRELGRGIKLYHLVYHAIRDMYAHGLLVCIQPSNGRCLKYRVKERS